MAYHLANSQKETVNIFTKIRFVIFYYLLQCTNPYGVKYGPFGLVTLNTFAKFILLYLKFFLITYKILHKFD